MKIYVIEATERGEVLVEVAVIAPSRKNAISLAEDELEILCWDTLTVTKELDLDIEKVILTAPH